jgi:hypothetical protein
MKALRHPRSVFGETSGATAVEFALIGGAFLSLITAILEFSVILFTSSVLESSVLVASRYGITGATTGELAREDVIRDIIEERTLGLVDMGSVQITTRAYESFGDIGQPEPFTDANGNGSFDEGEAFSDVNGNGHWDEDMGDVGLGGPGDVVLYEIEYTTQSLTPLLSPILGDIRHLCTVAVRNEPY